MNIFSTFGLGIQSFGNNFINVNRSGNWIAVSSSSTGQFQTAVEGNDTGSTVYIGYIWISIDYGKTWTQKSNDVNGNSLFNTWRSVSVSATGQFQTAGVNTGYVYISSDYGNTWRPKMTDMSRQWLDISISSSGQYQSACASSNIYVSSDFGNTWVIKDSNRDWRSIHVSSSGEFQTAVVYGGYIYTSNDNGDTWIQITTDTVRNWTSVVVSSTGQYQSACVWESNIYVSNDFGNTWNSKVSNDRWRSISMSTTGAYQMSVSNTNIYASTDFGNTWNRITNLTTNGYMFSVSVSSSGQYQTIISSYFTTTSTPGSIYVSNSSTYPWAVDNINNVITASGFNLNMSGNVTATSANINGSLIGTSANMSGNVTATSANINGSLIGTSANMSGNITATSANINGSLIGISANMSGNVTAATFNTTSDYRIKTNIEKLDSNTIVNLSKINPVSYHNILTNKNEYGFIAHELQQTLPLLVMGEKDGPDYQSVNYIGLIPLLVKEIQNMKQNEKELTKKIDNFELKLKELKQLNLLTFQTPNIS